MSLKIRYNYQTVILLFLWVSGMVKAFFTTYVLDLDIVIIAMVLALIDVVFVLATNYRGSSRDYFLGLLIIICLYVYIALSLSYSPSESYKFTKAINFIPNLVFFLYAMTLRKINLKLLLRLYALVIIPLAVFFIYMKSILFARDTSATRVFMDLRNNYLAIGLHLGILFFIIQYYGGKLWLKILVFFLLFASSARGALLFAVITYIIFYSHLILNFKLKKKLVYGGLVTMGALIVMGLVFWEKIAALAANAVYRLEVLLSGGGSSASNRVDMMQYAFTEPFNNPVTFLFGHGIGSFGIHYAFKDERMYPHNLFLEIFFELGLTGFLIIIVLLALVVIKSIKGKKLWMVLFFFCFLNAMKSSNLTDLWVLFSIMGISLNQNKITFNLK